MRFPFRRYVYYGIPPNEEILFYEPNRRPTIDELYYNNGLRPQEEVVYSQSGRTPKEVVINTVYDYLPFLYAIQPSPNYSLDDQIINQITYRILTTITQYKPKKTVEISPVTRMKIDLG